MARKSGNKFNLKNWNKCNCAEYACCCKGKIIGAFVFAGSVIWMLTIMGIIPPTVPWWLKFVTMLGFTAMFK